MKLRSAGILKTDLERGSVDEKARSSGRQININVQLLWAFEEARLDRSGYGGEVGVDKADQYKLRSFRSMLNLPCPSSFVRKST